jgi:hypothetical protein
MAHVLKTLTGSKFYTINYDPALLWDSATVFTAGMEVLSICMVPAAAADKVVVRDGGANGPIIFAHEAEDSFSVGFRSYFRGGHGEGVKCAPYVAAADATGNFILTFEIR